MPCDRHARLPALHRGDCDSYGFDWIVTGDAANSVLAYERRAPGGAPHEVATIVLNFTPVPRFNYRIGVAIGGRWRELVNTDAGDFGGSGHGNGGVIESTPVAAHGRMFSVNVTVPPLGALVLVPE